MAVRDLSENDFEGLSSLISSIFESDKKALWYNKMPSKQILENLFREKLNRVKGREGIDIVLEDETSVLGECEVVRAGVASAKIGILVDATIQRKGYGTMLLNAAIKKAHNMGITKLIAEVAVDNTKAMNFFAKNGFVMLTPVPEEVWHGTISRKVLRFELA